ncbi:hypothetical protein Sango_0307400, partial [Sesamum angolense]
ELPVEAIVWNSWRSRSLSYMLDNRTIRLVSGASLIFAAPEGQWTKIFGQLNILSDTDDLCETIELLLLGCIADRWSPLIEHLMSVSYESLTLSRLYHEVFKLSLGKSLHLFLKESFVNCKEKCVVNYLEVLFSSQLKQLWELPPVLAAVAIPSWSQLFRSYLHELEDQVRGNSLVTRRCSCMAGVMEHRELGHTHRNQDGEERSIRTVKSCNMTMQSSRRVVLFSTIRSNQLFWSISASPGAKTAHICTSKLPRLVA